jgi:hypothetical protein
MGDIGMRILQPLDILENGRGYTLFDEVKCDLTPRFALLKRKTTSSLIGCLFFIFSLYI